MQVGSWKKGVEIEVAKANPLGSFQLDQNNLYKRRHYSSINRQVPLQLMNTLPIRQSSRGSQPSPFLSSTE
jgi:hypothetical protein